MTHIVVDLGKEFDSHAVVKSLIIAWDGGIGVGRAAAQGVDPGGQRAQAQGHGAEPQ